MATNTKQWTDQFARVNGLRLHYLEWEKRRGPAIIMVHGLTGNAHSFDRLAPLLASKYHVLALDARGHGDSDWAKDANYFTEAHASDLEGLRQVLGFEKVSLIGTSMGGRICMAYAGLYPARVERLVMNDIGPEVAPQGGRRVAQSVGEAPDSFRTLEEVAAYWASVRSQAIKGMSRHAIVQMASYAVKKTTDGAFVWKVDPAVRENPRRPDPAVAWGWAKAIIAPVLLIRGGESDILSAEIAQRMVVEMKNCSQVVVPGVGHAPTLAEPEALNAIKGMFGL